MEKSSPAKDLSFFFIDTVERNATAEIALARAPLYWGQRSWPPDARKSLFNPRRSTSSSHRVRRRAGQCTLLSPAADVNHAYIYWADRSLKSYIYAHICIYENQFYPSGFPLDFVISYTQNFVIYFYTPYMCVSLFAASRTRPINPNVCIWKALSAALVECTLHCWRNPFVQNLSLFFYFRRKKNPFSRATSLDLSVNSPRNDGTLSLLYTMMLCVIEGALCILVSHSTRVYIVGVCGYWQVPSWWFFSALGTIHCVYNIPLLCSRVRYSSCGKARILRFSYYIARTHTHSATTIRILKSKRLSFIYNLGVGQLNRSVYPRKIHQQLIRAEWQGGPLFNAYAIIGLWALHQREWRVENSYV